MAKQSAKVRTGFTFYRSFRDAVALASPRDQLVLYRAIADYALDQTQPDLDNFSKTARICWVTILPNLDANLARFHNGCKPKTQRSQAKTKQTASKHDAECITDDNADDNADVNVNVNANDDANAGDDARAHDSVCNHDSFTPPTPEEVRDYIALKGLDTNAEAFVDYYTANGWQVGRSKMRDWRAAVRNWARRDDSMAFSLSLKIADNELRPQYQAL